jgi:hypothetical protein
LLAIYAIGRAKGSVRQIGVGEETTNAMEAALARPEPQHAPQSQEPPLIPCP